MDKIISQYSSDTFPAPQADDSYALKPVLRGKWQGGISTLTSNGAPIDPATASTLPYDSIQESLSGGVHSILYWINKDDPRGAPPSNPSDDPQFKYWEYGVTLWAQQHGY